MTTSPVVTITDELVAELEANIDAVWNRECRANTVFRALLSERAELKRDAERYAWIREHHNDAYGTVWVSAYHSGAWRSLDSAVHGVLAENADLDLDSAIDTAMQERQK